MKKGWHQIGNQRERLNRFEQLVEMGNARIKEKY
jgi:hypothetical protein